MGIMDFIKGELLEVIEWTEDSRDTLSWRFPDEDKAIKNGAQLIVRESQIAQFVYLGEFGDTFKPGKHTLTTDNIPVLTKLKSWPFGFNSPFKADVYFVVTRLFTGNKWGTSNPVMLRDNDFGKLIKQPDEIGVAVTQSPYIIVEEIDGRVYYPRGIGERIQYERTPYRAADLALDGAAQWVISQRLTTLSQRQMLARVRWAGPKAGTELRGGVVEQTSYGLRVALPIPYDEAVDHATAALKAEGFGVLTTIDVKQTIKQKLDKDFRRYVILGACNPPLAHRALTAELEIGLLLPCNVIVYEAAPGQSVVSAMAPMAALGVVGDNPDLHEVAKEADARLRRALTFLEARQWTT